MSDKGKKIVANIRLLIAEFFVQIYAILVCVLGVAIWLFSDSLLFAGIGVLGAIFIGVKLQKLIEGDAVTRANS